MAMNSLYGPAGISVKPNAIAGYDLASIGRKSPQQMELYNTIQQGALPGIQGGLGRLSRLAQGDESEFGALEAPAYSAFQRAGSQLASQFSGQGMGARHSSGFQNALAGGAASLAEQLQGKRMDIQRQSLNELLGLGKDLFSEDLFASQLVEPKSKWGSFLGGSLPWVGGALGAIGGSITGSAAGGVGAIPGAFSGASLGFNAGSRASKAYFGD